MGKEITKKYYGMSHNKSYYIGCSTGGRQGFKAVQSYPGDFDGVVAGAPVSLTNQSMVHETLTRQRRFISPG